jgi:Rieske Fe-S protein
VPAMADRRHVLVVLAGVFAEAFAGACGRRGGRRPLPPGAIRIPVADLPEGRRVVSLRVDEPVEVIRTAGVVVARSLFCTHFGCPVAWNEDSHRYLCPCHGGAFDAKGFPVAGPPTEPLRLLPVEQDADSIIVLPRQPREISRSTGN